MGERLERLLEAERAQLPPWFVVGFGSGIAAWFALGRPLQWAAVLCMATGLGLGASYSAGDGLAARSAGSPWEWRLAAL